MSRWMSEGGYELTAEAMFGRLSNFDVFLLEYDDERSGSFEPLAKAPARYTGLERLGISTQCGFSSTPAWR
jgi:hypothetical protein